VDLPVPPGFDGPTSGPSGDLGTSPAADQLTVHWTSATGSIEVRWPAGPGTFGQVEDRGTDQATGATLAISGDPRPVANGRHAVGIDVSDTQLAAAPGCQTIQIMITDVDPQRAREVGSQLLASSTEAGGVFGGPAVELVTSSRTADAPPEIPPCHAPAGVDHVDRVGGPVELGPSATAEEALRAFVDSTRIQDVDAFGQPVSWPTVVDRGYVATTLPDGSIAFVATVDQGVTVVHAVPTDGGWTIDRWDATGC
jgi:hypothetical protein